MNGLPNVTIWTDGFAWPNPGGAMGAGAVLVCGDVTKEVLKGFPAAGGNSNNRAELLAVILGLHALNRTATVEIKTDSQFVADGFATWRCGERRDRKNADLFAGIEQAEAGHDVAIQWVRGADELNRHADRLSRRAASELLPARAAEALRKYEEEITSGRNPGPLYQWLLRYSRGAA
jgi:ribonuclease HI